MPSKIGEFCARCARRCKESVRGGFIIRSCPNRHGEQGREEAPEGYQPAHSTNQVKGWRAGEDRRVDELPKGGV